MNKRILTVGLVLLAVFTTACGDDGESSSGDYTIAEQELQGQIKGQDWQFVQGIAQPSSFDDNELSIELYAEELEEPCGFSNSNEKPYVLASITKEPGEWPLSFQSGKTVTFVEPPSNNIIVTQGKLRIDSIEDDKVTGGLHGDAQDSGALNGAFELIVCE